MPHRAHAAAESVDARRGGRHAIVAVVPGEYLAQVGILSRYGSCRLRSSSSFRRANLARLFFREVRRLSWNLPARSFPAMWVKPRKSKVSGLASPRRARLSPANLPNSITRVFLRMKLQAEVRHATGEYPLHRDCVLLFLERHHEVIGVAHDVHLAGRISSGPCFARSPIRCKKLSTLVSHCVEEVFPATDFPLASALPSIDSTGVTHVFADFSGTTASSDFSATRSTDFRFSPSRGCLPSTIGGEASPRSPGSRADELVNVPSSSDPGAVRSPFPLFSDPHRGLPPIGRASAFL